MFNVLHLHLGISHYWCLEVTFAIRSICKQMIIRKIVILLLEKFRLMKRVFLISYGWLISRDTRRDRITFFSCGIFIFLSIGKIRISSHLTPGICNSNFLNSCPATNFCLIRINESNPRFTQINGVG